ncbi:MAG: hypothetical protein MMC33_001716 [Icmadophila ericetorum]|nr:hypothetical protein [Icmadophila ericetorum]
MAATASSGGDDVRSRGQQSPLASQRKDSNTSTEAKSKGRFSQFFPLGYKEAASQWWASVPAAAAEHMVLSYVPYLQQPPTHTQTGTETPSASSSANSISDSDKNKATPVTTNTQNDPYGPRQWHSTLVKLSGKNRAINEFSVERVGEKVDQNLVMLHGYGAGLGFFYKNFEGLSRVKGWKIYALDMLGMGRSSRPPFKIHAKEREASITEAENFFIDALEEWRIKRKIERFTLLGHSLGGYMAVAYALKYPGHLNKLVLASPVGIPEDPNAVAAEMPSEELSSSGLANEFTQDQEEITRTSNSQLPDAAKTTGDNNNFLNARSKNNTRSDTNTTQAPRRSTPKWLTYLWDANISPFSIVRWSGPLGPRFVSGWTSRRFSHLPPDQAQALHTYAYTLFKQRGSGEYALAYILAPGAFARSPLIRRIAGVGRQMITPSGSTTHSISEAASATPSPSPLALKKETGLPVILMYGENDWMDIDGGFAAQNKLNAERERVLKEAGEEEKKLEGGEAKVLVIKKAGHHVYLDGWEEFNDVMQGEMKDVGERERKREEVLASLSRSSK